MILSLSLINLNEYHQTGVLNKTLKISTAKMTCYTWTILDFYVWIGNGMGLGLPKTLMR